jgi:hypothetical protein
VGTRLFIKILGLDNLFILNYKYLLIISTYIVLLKVIPLRYNTLVPAFSNPRSTSEEQFLVEY